MGNEKDMEMQDDNHSEASSTGSKPVNPLSASIALDHLEAAPPRVQYASSTEFLFSCISYSIGLGNLWRFPYKCYNNGGGAFLIPYVLFLIFAGMPLYLLELSMGQFTSKGPVAVWHVSYLFVGIGYAAITIALFCSVYYNVIVAWVLRYLYLSIKALVLNDYVPWSQCSLTNSSNAEPDVIEFCQKDPSGYFFKHEILEETPRMGDLGGINWTIFGFLILAWILVCMITLKGVKSSGKVTYFTATFPYLIIAALLVRGLTLDGAWNGIQYYIKPDFKKLLDPEVWSSAATQIFYSLGIAFGTLTTLASFSPFDNNVIRMTLTVTTINCCTSIIGGFVIFGVIGNLAHVTGKAIEEVVDSGPGLAFVVYPDALSKMPGAAIWSILFFFMLLNLGFGSQIAQVETCITAITDKIPKLQKYRALMTILAGFVMFLAGIIMTTRSGIHWLNLFDTYSCSYSLFVVCLLEIVALIYIFGGKRVLTQIEVMTGNKPWKWWLFTWYVSAPLSIVLIFLLNIFFYKPLTYPDGEPIEGWAQAIGWITAMCSLIFIPIMMIKVFIDFDGPFMERLRLLIEPDELYRPISLTNLKKLNMKLKKIETETVVPYTPHARRQSLAVTDGGNLLGLPSSQVPKTIEEEA